jgi:flagellar basal body-associated protein FliL
LDERAPIVRNWLIGHLSDKSIRDLRGKSAQDILRDEIRNGLNNILFDEGEHAVSGVLFQEFNVQ